MTGTFEKQKKGFLSKRDFSRKGSIDEAILPLLKAINSKPDYYSTSSCAGRIQLIAKPDLKHRTSQLFVSHNPAKATDIMSACRNLPDEEVWFRQEGFIMHVCCRDLMAADRLLKETRRIFKRAGIISLRKGFVIETMSTELIDTIIAAGGKLLVTQEYLRILTSLANNKIRNNKKRIRKLKKIISAL
ncbi:MAG: tRNA wybutosine-synthesizing 3 family protein [archaeon]